jgi:hypothetical protein
MIKDLDYKKDLKKVLTNKKRYDIMNIEIKKERW